MTNLIPEQRVDKNGRLVTKHVRASAPPASGGKTPIPSPSLTAKPKKTKLLPRQTTRKLQMTPRGPYTPHPWLTEALPKDGGGPCYSFNISDEDAYGIFSVTSVDNAVLLIHNGYETKDDAVRFLNDNSLGTLREDNTALTEEALARRIPAISFAEFSSKHWSAKHETGVFLDAAEAFSSGTLRSLNRPYDEDTIDKSILKGDLSLNDIKAVGISKLQKSNASHVVLTVLKGIHAGEVPCTADDVCYLIDKNNQESNASSPLHWALQSIDDYGVDFLKGVDSLLSASSVAEHFSHRGTTVEKIKSLITYEQVMRRNGSSSGYKFLPRLMQEGVPAETAGKLHGEGKKIDQIVEIHQQGIHGAVTDGWL